MVFSSMLSGRDHATATHDIPKEPDREIAILFQHIRSFVEAAGGDPGAIANITFFVMDNAYDELVQREWTRMFPGQARQPARHTLNVAPAGLRGERVQAVVAAHVTS